MQKDATGNSEEKKIVDEITATSTSYHSRARAFLQSPGVLDEPATENGAGAGRGNHADAGALRRTRQSPTSTRLTKSGKDVGTSINETVRLLFFLMILACVVAIAASMGLTRGLLNPLASMAHSIQQVGEGDLDQKLPVLNDDEFGMLATSFNRMAQQLKTYRANTSEELLRLNMTIRATLASFP